MDTLVHDHLLAARDVCNNCFRLIREERADPTRAGLGCEYETRLTHRDVATQEGYHPADPPSNCRHMYCVCGVESARDRIWDYTEPDEARFKELLQNAIRTLEDKDVTIDRKRLASHAIAAWKGGQNVDGAIEIGLNAALARAVTK